MLQGEYVVKFRDMGATEMNDGAMLSSLNFVRIWMTTGFIRHSRRMLAGFVRPCESTDMQTSRLQDAVKCRPWEQLVKTGEEDMYLRCSAALGSSIRLPALPGVDDCRSSVCEQLREIGSQTPVTRRFPLKSPGPRTSGRNLGAFGHRTQETIGIQLTEAKRAASKKSVQSRLGQAQRGAENKRSAEEAKAIY